MLASIAYILAISRVFARSSCGLNRSQPVPPRVCGLFAAPEDLLQTPACACRSPSPQKQSWASGSLIELSADTAPRPPPRQATPPTQIHRAGRQPRARTARAERGGARREAAAAGTRLAPPTPDNAREDSRPAARGSRASKEDPRVARPRRPATRPAHSTPATRQPTRREDQRPARSPRRTQVHAKGLLAR